MLPGLGVAATQLPMAGKLSGVCVALKNFPLHFVELRAALADSFENPKAFKLERYEDIVSAEIGERYMKQRSNGGWWAQRCFFWSY